MERISLLRALDEPGFELVQASLPLLLARLMLTLKRALPRGHLVELGVKFREGLFSLRLVSADSMPGPRSDEREGRGISARSMSATSMLLRPATRPRPNKSCHQPPKTRRIGRASVASVRQQGPGAIVAGAIVAWQNAGTATRANWNAWAADLLISGG